MSGFVLEPTWPGDPTTLADEPVHNTVRSSEALVHREDVAAFDGMLACSSVGVVAVGAVDDEDLPGSAAAVAPFVALHDAVPLDPV